MNYKKFLSDVFRPLKTDRFVFIEETLGKREYSEWSRQHEMKEQWKSSMYELSRECGFVVLPDLKFNAPANHNASVYECVREDGTRSSFEEALRDVTVLVCFGMTSISSTLNEVCNKLGSIRGAAMPGIVPEMENTALAVDHEKLREKCQRLVPMMDQAEFGLVEFSTGHRFM